MKKPKASRARKFNNRKELNIMVSIEIIGNLGADLEKVNANGSEFYSFNVCDNRKVNGQEVSMWYGCNLNKVSDKLLPLLLHLLQGFLRRLATPHSQVLVL